LRAQLSTGLAMWVSKKVPNPLQITHIVSASVLFLADIVGFFIAMRV
jgi:hypothetical protein